MCRIIEFLTKEVKELVGGSCDLTGSNNTKSTNSEAITANDYRGNYIYYGVREHFMAACMNGMALHKGVIPYGVSACCWAAPGSSICTDWEIDSTT